jgi:hypothetical protein
MYILHILYIVYMIYIIYMIYVFNCIYVHTQNMGILGAGSFVSRNVSPTRSEEYYKLRKFRRAQIEVADCIGKGAYGTVWQVACTG